MSDHSDDDEQIDMKQAIGLLGITQPTFYRWLREGRVHGVKVGRQWRFRRGDIEAVARGETPPGLVPPDLEEWNDALRAAIRTAGGSPPAGGDDPLATAIELMLLLAVTRESTDLHLEPDESGWRLRMRIDGYLMEIRRASTRLGERLVATLKGMAHCSIHEHEKPQDGRLIFAHEGERLDCRLCCLPTLFGESLTLRLHDQRAMGLQLDQLQLRSEHAAAIEAAAAAPHGLVLVTGPAGSGKTTTLYAVLQRALDTHHALKAIAIEDPVEFTIPGVLHVPVREEQGLDFPRLLRSALRSAPNILMVGELRDLESIRLVHHAAITGHQVFSCLHTDDAPSALQRLRDVGMTPYQVVDALRLVVAQRLVRRVCPHCSEPRELDADERARVEAWAEAGGIDHADLPQEWRSIEGCDRCAGGYSGRLAVTQVLPVTGAVAEAVIAEHDGEGLQAAARAEGVPTLRAEMLRYAAEGATTLEEIQRVLDG